MPKIHKCSDCESLRTLLVRMKVKELKGIPHKLRSVLTLLRCKEQRRIKKNRYVKKVKREALRVV